MTTKKIPTLLDDLNGKKKLGPATRISKVFPGELPEETIHVIVQRPPPQVHAPVPARSLTPVPGQQSDGSRPSSPLSGDLQEDIKRIRDKFFAAGSKHAGFLVSYVQGQGSLPITETGLRGLPKVLRRGAVESEEAKPSLLFLDLPDPPSNTGDPVPERFKTNILLGVLEKMQAQDLPIFGVR
ncbi:hypothetical protein BGZ79_004151 [Entomortierella chlamydospora]|nr:hypothetical protein BGZ79_004151 [Entomortierella chlamydospora]